MARLVGAFGRRTIIMRLMLVALCMSAASAQATGEPCQTRSQPVGVSIEVTVDVHDERESSRSILGLLAYFGSSVVEGPKGANAPMPLELAGKYACDPIESDLTGKAVLVWRGECSYIEKASNAQDAGASAVIIVTDEEELSPMSCAGDADVIIPVMQVLEADGRAMELGVRTGITLVSLEELKMPGGG